MSVRRPDSLHHSRSPKLAVLMMDPPFRRFLDASSGLLRIARMAYYRDEWSEWAVSVSFLGLSDRRPSFQHDRLTLLPHQTPLTLLWNG